MTGNVHQGEYKREEQTRKQDCERLDVWEFIASSHDRSEEALSLSPVRTLSSPGCGLGRNTQERTEDEKR